MVLQSGFNHWVHVNAKMIILIIVLAVLSVFVLRRYIKH